MARLCWLLLWVHLLGIWLLPTMEPLRRRLLLATDHYHLFRNGVVVLS